jgi:hypothetical protein
MGRLLEIVKRDDHFRVPAGRGEGAVAMFQGAVLLVASDVVHAVRVARTYSRSRLVGRPVVLVVAHPGPAGEPPTLYRGRRRLPPELAAVVGRARRVLRNAGLDHAVLSVPFVDSEDGTIRTRRITSVLMKACRRLRASKLVIDELAYWEPGSPRVAASLRLAAETARLHGTALFLTGVPATHGRSAASPVPVAVPTARPSAVLAAARQAPEQSAVAC